MIAVLIVAGRSKRFWPLSEKTLFPIAGTTLVEEQIHRLQNAGMKKILIVGSKNNTAEVEALFPRLTIVQQEDLALGMRGALLSALPHCGDEPVMIVSGNDVIDPEAYKDLLKRARNRPRGGLILAKNVTEYFPGGYLSVHGNRITGIVEKPCAGQEPSNLINIVAHVHVSPAELLKALKSVKTTRDDGYEVALQTMLDVHPYEAVPYEGVWQSVKYPWHLLALLPVLLPKKSKPKIHRTAQIHRTAVIEGSVIIGKNVKVFAHATVMGPCVIGDDTIIASSALVRGSSIGRRCVIGYKTEIARSILADDVWTHSSYVGDSVLGDNISLGAGTTTGNLRFDETEIPSMVHGETVSTGLTKFGVIMGSGCRTGIHTCFAPGVKIGSGSFVNAATLVTEDIQEDSFVKMEHTGKLLIRKNRIPQMTPNTRDILRKKLS